MSAKVQSARSRRILPFLARPLAGLALGVLLVALLLSPSFFLGDLVLDGTDTVTTAARFLLIGGGLLGFLGGLISAHGKVASDLQAVITPAEIALVHKSGHVKLVATQVAEIVLDRDLVLRDQDGRELARARCTLPRESLALALTAAGYPKPVFVDPNESDYRWWTPGCPALDDAANQLILTREALLADGLLEEAEALRRRLAKRGIAVRDREPGRTCQQRQQWRFCVAA